MKMVQQGWPREYLSLRSADTLIWMFGAQILTPTNITPFMEPENGPQTKNADTFWASLFG